MAFNYPRWEGATVDYVRDNVVRNYGTVYTCISQSTVVASDTNQIPFLDSDNWQYVETKRLETYYDLIGAVELELNLNGSAKISGSVPMFIELAEDSWTTRLRVPDQRVRVILKSDSQSRIRIPNNLLNVINLRQNGSGGGSSYIQSRGFIEIGGANYEEYQELKSFYSERGGYGLVDKFEHPVYFYDGDYFWIAPDYPTGTEFELWYYAAIPRLGKENDVLNQQGKPVNKDGKTIEQWIAAGNSEDSFVPLIITTITNWWLQKAPQMCLYGTLVEASGFLDDADAVQEWQAKLEKAEAETQYKVEFFDNHRPHHIEFGNVYTV